MDVEKVEEKLKAAGFEIITSVPVDKKGTLISVVFTDKSLISMASKENRGFIASLRALVDTKEKTISIINPLYMAKGFLQADYDEKAAKKILGKTNRRISKSEKFKRCTQIPTFAKIPIYEWYALL